MTSIVASCATGPIIEFGGRFLRIHPRTLRHIAEIKAQVLHLRGDPVLLARILVAHAGDKKEEVARACLKTIRHRWSDVSAAEMNRFMMSTEGKVLTVYQALEANGVSYDWVFEKFCEKYDNEGDDWYYDFLWRVRMCSGEVDIFDLHSIRNLSAVAIDDQYERYGGDSGLFSVLGRKPFGYSPNEVREMTFAQIRALLADSNADNDDRPTERTEVLRPVNKVHRSLMEQTWAKRYSAIVKNLVDGNPLFDNLQN